MNRIVFVFFCFIPFCINAQWSLVWSDEFDGNSLDLSRWTHDTGTGCPDLCGWGNNELQFYSTNSANIAVDTGYLRISALEQSLAGADYTSARIKTQGLYDVQYGKIEARMKMPKGKGLWPAFWMLGSNITSVSWPQCGEIDIMEHVNHSPFVDGTCHYNDNGHTYLGGNTLSDVEQFQVYAIEWDSSDIKWFVNGTQYHQVSILNGAGSREEFHNSFFLLFNLAVGGNWPGAPDATTIFPAHMLIDYVRVYKWGQTSATSEIEQISNISVYPNPAKNLLNIETDLSISSYNLTSIDGKSIRKEVNLTGQQINISDLNPGFYFLFLEDQKGQVFRHKFVKE